MCVETGDMSKAGVAWTHIIPLFIFVLRLHFVLNTGERITQVI